MDGATNIANTCDAKYLQELKVRAGGLGFKDNFVTIELGLLREL